MRTISRTMINIGRARGARHNVVTLVAAPETIRPVSR